MAGNPDQYQKIAKQRSDLEELVATWRAYKEVQQQLKDNNDIVANESDEELRARDDPIPTPGVGDLRDEGDHRVGANEDRVGILGDGGGSQVVEDVEPPTEVVDHDVPVPVDDVGRVTKTVTLSPREKASPAGRVTVRVDSAYASSAPV